MEGRREETVWGGRKESLHNLGGQGRKEVPVESYLKSVEKEELNVGGVGGQ